jgi:hypothetical protein
LKYIGKGKNGGSSFINLVQIITLIKMEKIYKDLERRFELVNPWPNSFRPKMEKTNFKLPWSNSIKSHQTH